VITSLELVITSISGKNRLVLSTLKTEIECSTETLPATLNAALIDYTEDITSKYTLVLAK
jgi:hypothetical protein